MGHPQVIIWINSDWRVVGDPDQWIVLKRRIVTGRERWESRAYCKTLDYALLLLAQWRIRMMEGEYPAEALPTLCQALDSLKSEILKAIERAGLEAAH